MEQDILGAPYHQQTLRLGRDDEGEVVATIVRREAAEPDGRAVLYLHGFNDYFFQDHLAQFYVSRGITFYALDLRKHGRSLRPHQTPNFARSMTDYFPDLDAAVQLIHDDGHRRLLLNGHSTGGLVAALYAHRVRDQASVAAVFLNSPFVELNSPALTRHTAGPAFDLLAKVRPYASVPAGISYAYGESIHVSHHGEWDFDLSWKPIPGFPIRAGWLAAIRRAQAQLQAGLDIRVPVLVGTSTRSYRGARWSPAAQSADAVLNVAHAWRWAPALGRIVTVVRIEGGLHDLTLSAPAVRATLFDELDRWIGAYLP